MIGSGATDEIMMETIGCYKIIGCGWFLIGPQLQKNGQIIITKRLITEIGEYRFLPGYLYAFRCWSLYKRLTVGLLGFLNECQFSSSYRYLLLTSHDFYLLRPGSCQSRESQGIKRFHWIPQDIKNPCCSRCGRQV